MKKTMTLCLLLATSLLQSAAAQTSTAKKINYSKGQGPNDFPELVFTSIKGAPALQAPQLIMGETGPVKAEGAGFASPAWFDRDNDGKKDLLLGEFGSREEYMGMPVGNFVRVYRNMGSENHPLFTDIYNYVYPSEGFNTTGTPLSIYTWCCIGFTPRFVDLDNDGYQDLVTGQYNPGRVTWFRGTDQGFMPGQFLPQFEDDKGAGAQGDHSLPRDNPGSIDYWNYSAVDFGDFDGKGLSDMIVGGSALRISKNVGTKTAPQFGRRELLLDVTGAPLILKGIDPNYRTFAGEQDYGYNMVPVVADWDQDGLPDILVTDCYLSASSEAITFFRAVKTEAGLRFEPGVPLFTAATGGKAFPGSWLRVCVADYNSDGVQDLIVGASVATLSRKFDHHLSWSWDFQTGIVKKNPGYYSPEMKRLVERELKVGDSTQRALKGADEATRRQYSSRESSIKNHYGKLAYKTLAHQGYVYVLLGKKTN